MRERYSLLLTFQLRVYFFVFCNVLLSKAGPNATISTAKCPASINNLVIKSISFPPYLRLYDDHTVKGELEEHVQTAIERCCPRLTGAIKYYNLNNSISTSDDIELMIRKTPSYESLIFFPVFASRDAKEQYDRNFLALWESPGFAVVQIEKDTYTEEATDQLDALVKAWPILLVCVLTAILSGVILWVLDCRKNEEFSTGFISGAGSGIWWSFVTMTTVGYGDKSPKSPLARCFAIIWMIIGTVLLSMLSAQITAYLTSIEVDKSFTIQDEKVAIPLGLQNFLERDMNLGAKYQEYPLITIVDSIKQENASRIGGRKYAILHNHLKIERWMLSMNETINFRHKLMINHPLYLGAVATFLPSVEINAFFQCLQRTIRDQISVRLLNQRAKYREKLRELLSPTTQSSNSVQNTALIYLAAAAAVFLSLGLIWEFSRRLKKKSASLRDPK